MFEKRKMVRQAGREREALAPMAASLGVDPTYSVAESPVTMEARVFDAYRVGQRLLTDFKAPNSWPVATEYQLTATIPALSKRAAKLATEALASTSCLDAISAMAQGYGREMSAIWCRFAASETVGDEEAVLLNLNADRSAALVASTAEHWPVPDLERYAGFVEKAHRYRESIGIDLDAPDAMVDLHQYYGKAGAVATALAVLLGDRLDDELQSMLFQSVARLDMRYSLVMATIWNSAGRHVGQPLRG